MKSTKTKNLQEFIESVGDEEAARLFRVKPRTTAAWRRGERSPRREQARLIVKQTAKHPHGPVTMDGIYA